jgi:hypothetical protein
MVRLATSTPLVATTPMEKTWVMEAAVWHSWVFKDRMNKEAMAKETAE